MGGSITYIISCIIGLACAVACPLIASKKNRSVGGWIVGGIFLGLLGLIIILCLKPKAAKK